MFLLLRYVLFLVTDDPAGESAGKLLVMPYDFTVDDHVIYSVGQFAGVDIGRTVLEIVPVDHKDVCIIAIGNYTL